MPGNSDAENIQILLFRKCGGLYGVLLNQVKRIEKKGPVDGGFRIFFEDDDHINAKYIKGIRADSTDDPPERSWEIDEVIDIAEVPISKIMRLPDLITRRLDPTSTAWAAVDINDEYYLLLDPIITKEEAR